MEIKTTIRYHLTPVEMAIIKKKKITGTGEDAEKREPFVGRNVKCYNHYGKGMEFSQNN